MDNSKKPEKENPRSSTNPVSQLIFLWIIPFLFRGTTRGLNTDDLTKCMEKDHSEVLGDKLETEWEKELVRSKRKNKEPSLRNALFKTFIGSCIVDGILCFLFVLIKSLQPIVLGQLLVQFQSSVSVAVLNLTELDINRNLTKRSLNDLETNLNSIQDDLNKNTNPEPSKIDEVLNDSFIHYIWNDINWLASGLVLMTLLGVFFNHHSDLRQRLVGARMRIACCSMIYRKTLKLSKKTAGQTAAGYIVNLLSNDVGRLDYGFIFAHYIWILPFQSVLICYLIYREIGVAALVGVIGLLLKTIPVQTGLSRLSSMLRMKVAIRTDSRVGIMNELIQGIQVIKMYAWEKPFHAVVSEARRKEVKQIRYSSYIRGVFLSTMVFTERSTLFITIAACVWMKQAITADIVFSMAQYFNVLQLTAAIFYPLAVSMGAEALVSITRVQAFLMQEEHDSTTQGLKKNVESDLKENESVLTLSNLTASWDESSKKRTLENISVDIPKGKLYAVIGPVGAGKSSLLQLLLGELPIHSGNVVINGEVSYASQEPWLFTGSVRNNILFGLDFDQKRYKKVVKHCALLTDFAQLPNGDRTIVGERGTRLSGGQKARVGLARAVYKNASVYLLDDPLSAVDANVGKHLFDKVIGPKGILAAQKCTRILVTHQVHFLKEADWIIILEDGKISKQGTYRDLSNSDLDFAKLLEKLEDVGDGKVNNKLENYEDTEEVAVVNGSVGVKEKTVSESSPLMKSVNRSGKDDDAKETAENQAQGNVPFRVWRKYFSAGGSCGALFLLVSVIILSQVVTSGSDYFVNYWTQQEYLRMNNLPTTFTNEECLLIYGISIIGIFLITNLRSYLFFKVCLTASKCLHNKMFANLLNAPMRFFDTNPSGRILNRFSKDMGSIDESLPYTIVEASQIVLVMVGILALISIINPSLLLVLVGAICLYSIVLKLYLRPAQDLKRLEGICRSPVFSHLSATLNGLSTIRANGAQNKVANEFDGLQDVHSAVWQLTISSNSFLEMWLDMISFMFVACVTFSFVLMDVTTFSGNVGLAIGQSLILTGMVQYGIRLCAESIQLMTSVERVLQYTDLEPEFSPNNKAPKDWPQHGKIEFKKISLRYNLNDAPVLKNLQIVIEPSWKVGIVGRTGAGKSSLIGGALFRLANVEGQILIDGVDTGSISLEDLRKNVSIIPQDPVLFSATIRYNLDPFGLFDDNKLWEALEDVELKNQVGHLDFMVTEGGSNFSVGQRQLICLARAILRNNKVLVLDEATANVDPQTDALIQKTIRSKFKECTVLTVAHRLHTVMDSDRILVMDAGFAKEFDIPHNLIQKEHSLLRDMIEANGVKESESLKKIAAENYVQKFEANKETFNSNEELILI